MSSIKRINTVLKTLSQTLSQKPSTYSIVSGNQSGDLDSIVSAITYAYFSHIHNSQDLIIPLLNFSRKELNSRKDALLLFQKHQIDATNLFFTDDLNNLSKANGIFLVDHNLPQGKVKTLTAPIRGIIDHHEDEGQFLNADPRIISVSGSCSSLVFKYWYDLIQNKNSIDPDVIKILLAPLVIDTTNLTSKVEQTDVEVSKIYQNYLDGFDTVSFFKEIKEAKNDIEGLPAHEVFGKDYKDFESAIGNDEVVKRVGVTSVVKPFEWLQSNFPDLNELALEFAQNEQLDIFIIMTSFVDAQGSFNREIGIIAKGEANEILTKLATESVTEYLQLKPLSKFTTTQSPELRVFQQQNLAASRKQVIPAFKKAFERL